jgi:hypothetical protein
MMEVKKAKKTRKKAGKSGTSKNTKEGAKRKRTKGTKNKTMKTKTSTKEVIRVKDVKELVEYCKQQFGRKPFQGASIDFHPKKPAFIFTPDDNSVTKVETQKLLDFLKERNVRSVLVDALNKKRLPTLVQLCEAGFEVFVLRRTSAIEQLRRELRRQNIEVPKSDKYDAVLLAFTPPKKWALVDSRFLKAWEAMVEWRNAETSLRVEKQRYDANKSEGPKGDEKDEELRIKELIRVKLEKAQRLLEEVQKLEAQLFVLKVQKQYNVTEKDFQKLGIETDDTVAKAYACEAILEAIHCNTLIGFINKAGIRLSKKGRPLIHDGRLSYVLHQLTIKVYHLDVNNQRGKIRYKKLQLAKKILKLSRRIRGSGRAGEAFGAGPPEREGYSACHPILEGGACEKQEKCEVTRSQGPRHPADRLLQP